MEDFKKKLFQKTGITTESEKKNGRKADAEDGQGLVEYALILFLVAVVVIAVLVLLGPQIGSVFSAVHFGMS